MYRDHGWFGISKLDPSIPPKIDPFKLKPFGFATQLCGVSRKATVEDIRAKLKAKQLVSDEDCGFKPTSILVQFFGGLVD